MSADSSAHGARRPRASGNRSGGVRRHTPRYQVVARAPGLHREHLAVAAETGNVLEHEWSRCGGEGARTKVLCRIRGCAGAGRGSAGPVVCVFRLCSSGVHRDRVRKLERGRGEGKGAVVARRARPRRLGIRTTSRTHLVSITSTLRVDFFAPRHCVHIDAGHAAAHRAPRRRARGKSDRAPDGVARLERGARQRHVHGIASRTTRAPRSGSVPRASACDGTCCGTNSSARSGARMTVRLALVVEKTFKYEKPYGV